MDRSTFIVLHVGQCGVQWGNATWELYGLEHGIDTNGYLCDPDCQGDDVEHDSLYHQTKSGKYIPSCMYVDLEPDVIDEIRSGVYRNLFHPRSLITGCEDASNNFARGFYSIGLDILPAADERIRKMSEQCNKIRGFMLTHSIGGGTGAGLTAGIMLDIREDYIKTPSYQFSIVPSQQLTSAIVEPYNALLHAHYTIHTDMNMLFDNESLYNLIRSNLNIDRPTFSNINRLLAQTISHITCTERFSGQLNTDLSDIKTNLIPYPDLHFPILNTTPIIAAGHENSETFSLMSLVRNLFHDNSLMVACPSIIEENLKVLHHKFIACALLFRGSFSHRQVHETLYTMRRSINFVDWCPTGFRCGMCDYPPVVPPLSNQAQSEVNVTMMSNTTAVSQIFRRLKEKFARLYKQGAFLHWYEREGMPEEDWEESVETVKALLAAYKLQLDEDDDDSFHTKSPTIKSRRSHPPNPAYSPSLSVSNVAGLEKTRRSHSSHGTIEFEEMPVYSAGGGSAGKSGIVSGGGVQVSGGGSMGSGNHNSRSRPHHRGSGFGSSKSKISKNYNNSILPTPPPSSADLPPISQSSRSGSSWTDRSTPKTQRRSAHARRSTSQRTSTATSIESRTRTDSTPTTSDESGQYPVPRRRTTSTALKRTGISESGDSASPTESPEPLSHQRRHSVQAGVQHWQSRATSRAPTGSTLSSISTHGADEETILFQPNRTPRRVVRKKQKLADHR